MAIATRKFEQCLTPNLAITFRALKCARMTERADVCSHSSQTHTLRNGSRKRFTAHCDAQSSYVIFFFRFFLSVFFSVFFFVCESMSNVGRTRAHVTNTTPASVQSSSQRFGAWSFDTILPGYQWAHQWVPARTPTVHWGPISGKAVGGPNTVQHSSTVQKHGKHGSGALATRALVTRVWTQKRVCCSVVCSSNEDEMRLKIRRSQLMWKSVLVKVMTNRLCTDRGKDRCPGMIITCAQIQVAGKIVERSSHKARLTELNTSDETFLRDDHHLHFDSDG